MLLAVTRPEPSEHIEYYSKYINLIPGADVRGILTSQGEDTQRLLAHLSDSLAMHRYATGKWSVKEVLGHITDAERVFAYRALRFGRGDATPLAGFDENIYVPASNADVRSVASLRAEMAAVRSATVSLLDSFDEDALLRSGPANGHPISVRALLWIVAGHEKHHVTLLRERYGLKG
jgi:uncharacterized damage-inducible protein DinB